MTIKRLLAISLISLVLSGCAVYGKLKPPPMLQPAYLTDSHYITADGQKLPLARFKAANQKAIFIAVHGFNDYRRAFANFGQYMQSRGITTISYDQRGFGETENAGRWAGSAAMTQDLQQLTHLLKKENPKTPLYILGDSMGGAVALVTASEYKDLPVEGIVLVAPAVWARQTMGIVQSFGLWFSAHTLPWLELSPKGLGIQPSDNMEMLRELGRDPLVRKSARPDTLYGMADLMDEAFAASSALQFPTLILYGGRDQIIPKKPICEMIKLLPQAPQGKWTVAIYPAGYHMLLRDLDAEKYFTDILAWMDNKNAALSNAGETVRAYDAMRKPSLCNGWFY